MLSWMTEQLKIIHVALTKNYKFGKQRTDTTSAKKPIIRFINDVIIIVKSKQSIIFIKNNPKSRLTYLNITT